MGGNCTPAAASNVLAGRFAGLPVAEALSTSARDERARAIQSGAVADLAAHRSAREPAAESSDLPTRSPELALFFLLVEALGAGTVAAMHDVASRISEETFEADPSLAKARAMIAKLAAIYA